MNLDKIGYKIGACIGRGIQVIAALCALSISYTALIIVSSLVYDNLTVADRLFYSPLKFVGGCLSVLLVIAFLAFGVRCIAKGIDYILGGKK